MATAEQVTRYRAKDGTVFETETAADRHDAANRIGEILATRAAYGEIDVSAAVEALMEHAAEVARLLEAHT